MITFKMAYSEEANKELRKYLHSKGQFITMNGKNGRLPDKEGVQAMYQLTLVLPDDVNKITKEVKMG